MGKYGIINSVALVCTVEFVFSSSVRVGIGINRYIYTYMLSHTYLCICQTITLQFWRRKMKWLDHTVHQRSDKKKEDGMTHVR